MLCRHPKLRVMKSKEENSQKGNRGLLPNKIKANCNLAKMLSKKKLLKKVETATDAIIQNILK